jgi:hypothetical protein
MEVRRRSFDPSNLPWAISQRPFDLYRAGAKVYRAYRAYRAGGPPHRQPYMADVLCTLVYTQRPCSSGCMPYLGNSRLLEEFWTIRGILEIWENHGLQVWHGDLPMPKGLKLINDVVCNKYYMFQEIS